MNSERRQFLQRAALCSGLPAAAWALPALAQAPAPPSAAAREAKALPLPAPGTPITLPDVELLDGSRFEAARVTQQVVVIYWWSSTCPFCALQSPEIEKLWQSQRQQPDGLKLLTLSIDRKPELAAAYLRKKGYTFPAAWVTPEVHRVLPKPKGLPITLVRGRDGRVLQAESGQLFPEDVEQLTRWLA